MSDNECIMVHYQVKPSNRAQELTSTAAHDSSTSVKKCPCLSILLRGDIVLSKMFVFLCICQFKKNLVSWQSLLAP